MAKLKRFLLRHTICRFKGHLNGRLHPLFVPWYGGCEIGSIHCKRCGIMIGDY